MREQMTRGSLGSVDDVEAEVGGGTVCKAVQTRVQSRRVYDGRSHTAPVSHKLPNHAAKCSCRRPCDVDDV